MEGAIAKLRDDEASFPAASKTLLTTVQKIMNNVAKDQNEPKYRRLPVDNKNIKEKVLAVSGGAELLAAIGFVQQSDALVLPMDASPTKIQQCRESIDPAWRHQRSSPRRQQAPCREP